MLLFHSQGWLGLRGHECVLLHQQSQRGLRLQSPWSLFDVFHSWPLEFELGRLKKKKQNALPFKSGDTFLASMMIMMSGRLTLHLMVKVLVSHS